MSKARESATWKWLSQARRSLGENLFMERVENTVAEGTPDVDGLYQGRAFKLELKSAEQPARLTTPVRTGLSRVQVDWAKDYIRAGGRNLFLLIRVGPRRRYLIPAREFERLYSSPVPDAVLADLSVVPPDASPADFILAAARRY